MLLIGNYNRLKIVRINTTDAILESDDGEIILPWKLVPKEAKTDGQINVFIYVDSDGHLTATTRKPRAVVGDFALLKVKDNVSVGTFLDWGLEKDLLLPYGEQTSQLRRGEKVLVRVYLHSNNRVVASTKIDRFIRPADGTLAEGDMVELLVYSFSNLGVKVIVNNTFGGLLFHNELVIKPSCGERLMGFVKKIRDDGKIDVTLRKAGFQGTLADREVIMIALRANDGLLHLNDKSLPRAIAELLRMSKKSFKKGVGGLYKEGLVDITPEGIKLRSRE